MHRLPFLMFAALSFAAKVPLRVSATTFAIETYFGGAACGGTPYLVNANEAPDCAAVACKSSDYSRTNSTPQSVGMVSVECTTDYLAALRKKFGSSPYIIQVLSPDSGCATFGTASGFPATGNCEGSFDANDSMGVHLVGTLEPNGSATMQYFSGSPCISSQWFLTESVDSEALAKHSCEASRHRWYSSLDVSTAGSDLSVGAVVGVVAACLIVLVVVGVFILRRQRFKKKQSQHSLPLTTAMLEPIDTDTSEAIVRGRHGLWEDEVITTRRIPRDKIRVKKLITRGASGAVYIGVFNRQKVAIKMLLPTTRGSLQHVNDFLAEAKLTATMDHPHIVNFVGVAWDSLSDLCVLLEFMDGGDLRSLLDKYKSSNRSVGFDRHKITIALHVCHALTYLHSLEPPVVHRDLKSRNVLLNKAMEAKVTDFGISREYSDRTLTAGVGTSLWMAPEVMLGEKYDTKADMFSFGVVLSELDVHTLPYAHNSIRGNGGNQVSDTALLQKVTSGEIRVKFSSTSPRGLVELGCACVSVDPSNRPSASEALHRLHTALTKDLA